MFFVQKSPRQTKKAVSRRAKPAFRSHLAFRSRRRGAALVEFALVAVLFCALLLGMLQFGIYLSVTNSLWNLSREGARVAAVQTTSTANADQAIIDHIKRIAPPTIDTKTVNTPSSPMQISITPTNQSARTAGTPVKVEITYDMRTKLLVPNFKIQLLNGEVVTTGFLGSNYTTSTTMMVEAN